MEIELWVFSVWSGISTLAAMYFAGELSLTRTQVKRLQKQRRLDREARGRGGHAARVLGLWPDLDEKQRLRDRVEELEAAQSEDG